MIALASGIRVYLACGTTDMRNYVECLVMRRAWPGASVRRCIRPFRSA